MIETVWKNTNPIKKYGELQGDNSVQTSAADFWLQKGSQPR